MSKKKNSGIAGSEGQSSAAIEKRRKRMEATATFGLILIAVALLAPFASFMADGETMLNPNSFSWRQTYKWIYAAGALIFTFARLVNVSDPKESLRIRRIRRLEFWAGMAFCIGGFFWFYNTQKLSGMLYVGQMAILRDTVVFSLAGAMLQIISSWMLVWRQKKEAEAADKEKKDKKGEGV